MNTLIFPILEMKKVRHRKVEELAEAIQLSKW